MGFAVSLPGAALAEAAQWTAALTARRPTEPALGGVLLVADTFAGGDLTLSGTDHDTTGTVTAWGAEVSEGGRRLVSGQLLSAIAARIAKEPAVALRDDDDGRLEVSTGDGSWWSLPCMAAEDYPGLPQPATPVATVGAATFARALDRVSLAVSDPKAPPMHGGISLCTHPGLGLVIGATDRYRLAVAEIEWTPVKPDETGVPEVLVPAPILRAAVTAVGDAKDDEIVTIHADRAGGFGLSTTRHQVIGRLIDRPGEVWRRIDHHVTTTEATAHVDVASAALRQALDRVTVALDADETVVLTFDETAVEIAPAKGEKARAAHRAVHDGFGGEFVRFGCKPEYLRDLLTGLAAEVVRLRYLGGRNPMIGGQALDAVGEVVPGFRMAQAPVSLAEAAAAP